MTKEFLRELSDTEIEVKEYIVQYPGVNTEDVGNALGNTIEIYSAVGYLVANLYVDRDSRNQALYVNA